MKKLLFLFVPLISLPNTTYIDSITYNGEENRDIISLNSNIYKNKELNVSDIDLLVDNFKFAKNNDMKVNIEPSNKPNYVNVVITNKKKNPLSLSVGIDNYGKSEDDGIYRYTIDAGLSGLILNENINLSYTFVSPKNPKRREIPELKPGEMAELLKPQNMEKARKNNNVNLELSFPVKNVKTYLNYSYNDYKKSIIGNNDIYDVSGNSRRIEIKENVEVYRNKKKKLNLVGKYSYIDRKSYLEDVLLSNDKIHNIGVGLKYTNENVIFESIFNNKLENKKYIPSLESNLSVNKALTNKTSVGVDINTNIEKNNNILEYKVKTNVGPSYLELGVSAKTEEVLPIIKAGLRKDIGPLYFDTAVEFKEEFKGLFNVKLNILK